MCERAAGYSGVLEWGQPGYVAAGSATADGLYLHVGSEKLFGAAEFLRFFLNAGRRDQRLDIFFGDVDGVIVGDVIQSFALGGKVSAVAFFERGRVLLSALEL